MSKVCVRSIGVSLDGFSAGPGQDLEHPLGIGGEKLFEWFFKTRTFCAMHGKPGGDASSADDRFAQQGFENIGAWIIGRNMFGPVRGPWLDESWRGWWGEEPPYHVPVFVLTHHARPTLEMQGGTTFHFVTDGIESALKQAQAAAAGKDVRIGGGVSTVRQYLSAGLVDEVHLAVAPVFLGRGENLLTGMDLPGMGFKVTEHVATDACTHVVLHKAE
jgi:dihydrofolate reductase